MFLPVLLAEDIPLMSPIPTPTTGLQDMGSIIGALIQVLFIIAGLATFIQLVLGGFQWITSGGDPKKTEAAGKQITNAIIGLGIVAVSWAIMKLLETFFNVHILSGFTIPKPK